MKSFLYGFGLTFSFIMNVAFAVQLYYQFEFPIISIDKDTPVIFECNGRPIDIA